MLYYVYMTFYNGLIGLFWLIFIVVWIFSAFSAKKTLRKSASVPSWFGWRLVLAIILYFLFRNRVLYWLAPYDAMIEGNPTIHLIGVILCGVGIAFAIWARYYLGKNWGLPMSVKEDPQLVVGGPYALVRHPIYSGMMLAMLGSVLASTLLWLVLLAFTAGQFMYSAKAEEALMQKEFPEKYPAYKKRTKMLVPFLY